MKYETPKLKIERFTSEAFLNDDFVRGDGNIDNSNINEFIHEVIDDIFTP